MIVTANRLSFSSGASKHLKVNDTVSVSSGMGGSYGLMIRKITDDGVRLGGRKDQDLPSYYKNAFFTWDELESKFYLLMPTIDYGLFQEHINIAKAAGYKSRESIIHAIAKTNNVSDSLVELMLNRTKKIIL
jgi:hypothetical protein